MRLVLNGYAVSFQFSGMHLDICDPKLYRKLVVLGWLRDTWNNLFLDISRVLQGFRKVQKRGGKEKKPAWKTPVSVTWEERCQLTVDSQVFHATLSIPHFPFIDLHILRKNWNGTGIAMLPLCLWRLLPPTSIRGEELISSAWKWWVDWQAPWFPWGWLLQ